MDDVNDYVGIPWQLGGFTKQGADCWGLTLMVCKNCYGVKIPLYLGSCAEGDALAEIISTESSGTSWQQIAPPQPGDVCIMKSKDSGRPEHIGVYVGSKSVIHSLGKNKQGVSMITRTKALEKLFQPLEFYRYVGDHNYPA